MNVVVESLSEHVNGLAVTRPMRSIFDIVRRGNDGDGKREGEVEVRVLSEALKGDAGGALNIKRTRHGAGPLRHRTG